jgi:hypothetical protein
VFKLKELETITRSIERNFPIYFGLLICVILSTYLVIYKYFASPRRFRGDFYAVMFDPTWWDGSGVVYGPLVVFERWMVNAFPRVFTIEFFGFFNLVLIGLSIAICIKVTSSDRLQMLMYIVFLSLNSFFLYSFSVAANPELIELALLCILWWGLSRRHIRFSWFVLTLAILTKLVPVILVPLLFAYFSWAAVLVSAFAAFFILVVVSIGQNQSPFLTIAQILDTKSVDPQPTSEQFLGLSSALARMLGIEPGENFSLANNLALGFSIGVYIIVLALTLLVYKSHQEPMLHIRMSYLFVLYLSVIPILHQNAAHRHTFLFLAPVFVGLSFILKSEPEPTRAKKYKIALVAGFLIYSFLPVYLLDFYNFDFFSGIHFGQSLKTSVLYLTEPIWFNVALTLTLMIYGKSRFLSPNHLASDPNSQVSTR